MALSIDNNRTTLADGSANAPQVLTLQDSAKAAADYIDAQVTSDDLTANGEQLTEQQTLRAYRFNGRYFITLTELFRSGFMDMRSNFTTVGSQQVFQDYSVARRYTVNAGSVNRSVLVVNNSPMRRSTYATGYDRGFLTSREWVDYYDGYPLQVSFMATNDLSALSVGRDSATITDDVRNKITHCTLRLYSDKDLALLYSDPVTVGLRATMRVRKQTLACGENLWVRWLNPWGGYDHYMFTRVVWVTQGGDPLVADLDPDQLATEPTTTARDVVAGKAAALQYGREISHRVILRSNTEAGGNYDSLFSLSTSPRVQLYDPDRNVWDNIFIDGTTMQRDVDKTSGVIEVTAIIPPTGYEQASVQRWHE